MTECSNPALEPVSVIIPAHNEAETIARVIERVGQLKCVDEVIAANNASGDQTADVARNAGARVVTETRPGMGYAVRAAIEAAQHDWVMKVDADLDRFDVSRFQSMIDARAAGVGMVKGNWSDPQDDKPMTRLLVNPMVSLIAPGLDGMGSLNSGLYVVDRRCVATSELVGSYAVDLDMMLRVYSSGARVIETDIGELVHDRRSVGHYTDMAAELARFLSERHSQDITQEFVLFGEALVTGTKFGEFLEARLQLGGRVTVLGPRQGEAQETRFANWPNYHQVEEVVQFSPSSNAGDLCVIVPPRSEAPVLEEARALIARVACPARLLQILEPDEPVEQITDTLSVRSNGKLVSAVFRHL